MELSDWLPEYPDPHDPLFQQKLASKKEFQETAAKLNEPAPSSPGELFSYQKFDKLFMRVYDRVLLLYEAGTGKTCGYLSVAEDFKIHSDRRLSLLSDAIVDYYQNYYGQIKRVYILLKSKSLIPELKKQLVCKCTAGTYLTERLLKADNERNQKSAVTAAMSAWYEVTTYIRFTNAIHKEKLSDTQIKERFEGCLFIFDEIHAVRNELIVDKEDIIISNSITHIDEDHDKKVVHVADQLRSQVYDTLWKVVHLPEWVKIIAATATPMINDVKDFIEPMNLVLPKDRQLPLNSQLMKWTIEDYQHRLGGYISFLKVGDTGVDVNYLGETLKTMFTRADGTMDPSQLYVQQYKMEEFQAKVYRQLLKNKMSGFRNDERQATSFVYPDGSYGGNLVRLSRKNRISKHKKADHLPLTVSQVEAQAEAIELGKVRSEKERSVNPASYGMGKYIESPSVDQYHATKEFVEATNSIEKIRKLSVVYAAIIQQSLASKGICFIYQELLNGSGAIALAMCFESMGVERFKQLHSPFETQGKKRSNRTSSYCAQGSTETEIRKININKKLRYALITSETSDIQDTIVKQVVNSDENMHGDYIKILIGSEVTRDGINLANVQDVFIPSIWTPSGMYQAISRALRATSHIKLINQSKTKRVTVNIHRMAAYVIEQGERVSVDLDMYRIAERKDREIAQVRYKIRQVAVDCILHKDRNVKQAAGKDYTAECDYDVCAVPCYAPFPASTDVSTYRIFYSAEERKEIKENITLLFNEISHVTISELEDYLNKDRMLIQWTVEQMMDLKTIVRNKFGLPCLVTLHQQSVYLVPLTVRDVVHDSPRVFLDNYYTTSLIIQQSKSLSLFAAEQKLIKSMSRLHKDEEEEDEENNKQNAGQDVSSTDIDALRIETILIKRKRSNKKKTDNVLTNAEKALLTKYQHYWYEFKEPVESLQYEQQMRERRGKGRGRKPKEDKINYRKDVLHPDSETGRVVFVHSIYTIPVESTAFKISAKFMNAKGRLRIWIPSEGDWRDTSMDERVVYNALIRGRIEKMMQGYITHEMYGSVLTDGIFRIHDRRNQVNSNDLRTVPRGLGCNESWKNDQLLLIAKDLNIPSPSNPELPSSWSTTSPAKKADLIAWLDTRHELKHKTKELSKYTVEELTYIANWMIGFNRGDLCERIKTQFKTLGRLFEAFVEA